MSNPINTSLRNIITLSAQGAGSVSSATLPANFARGITVYFNATAAATSPTLVFSLMGVDPVSGNAVLIAASSATAGIAGATELVCQFYPGLGATTASNVNAVIPAQFQIKLTVAVGTLTGVCSASLNI